MGGIHAAQVDPLRLCQAADVRGAGHGHREGVEEVRIGDGAAQFSEAGCQHAGQAPDTLGDVAQAVRPW